MKQLAAGMIMGCLIAGQSAAEGDPTWRATRLEPLEIDAREGFSITRYEIETGVYYRWRIESDGLEEYRLLAPELFRQSWIDRVVIEDSEVFPLGLHAVAMEDEGGIDIWFVPIRPGTYGFHIEGLEGEGFIGEFVVK